MALFHARGHWSEADKVLTECAGAAGPKGAEDASMRRALSLRLLRRGGHPRRPGRAAAVPEDDLGRAGELLRAAPLRMLHGEWTACARGFDAYLSAHSGGQDARDASRDGALCKLQAGETKASRATFEELVEDEPDPIVSSRTIGLTACLLCFALY